MFLDLCDPPEQEMDSTHKKQDFYHENNLTQVERHFEQAVSDHDSSEFNTRSQTRISIYPDETEVDQQMDMLSWK